MKVRAKLILVAFSVLLFNCASNPFKDFYSESVNLKTSERFAELPEDKIPELFFSENLPADVYIMRSKLYDVVGFSSFNGVIEDPAKLKAHAKDVGASVVLLSQDFVRNDTQIKSTIIPSFSNSYFAGSYSGLGSSGIFSGNVSTTTYNVVPMAFNYSLYDQTALYLAPYKEVPKLGFYVLPPDYVKTHGISTPHELSINIVYEGMVEEKLGLKPNDIIKTINGKLVLTYVEFVAEMKAAFDYGEVTLTVERGTDVFTFSYKLPSTIN